MCWGQFRRLAGNELFTQLPIFQVSSGVRDDSGGPKCPCAQYPSAPFTALHEEYAMWIKPPPRPPLPVRQRSLSFFYTRLKGLLSPNDRLFYKLKQIQNAADYNIPSLTGVLIMGFQEEKERKFGPVCWELHVIDRHSQHTWKPSTTGIIAKKLGEDRCSKSLSTLWIFDSTCAYLFSSYHAESPSERKGNS